MKKYVLPDGVEIKEISQKMYSNGNGFAYPDIRSAEYAAAIGQICEDCGAEYEGKTYICCPSCRKKHQDERFLKLELTEWDGIAPICIWMDDKYFFGESELYDYCDNNELKPSSLRLVLCVPNKSPIFDLDDFLCDVLPEYTGIDEISVNSDKTAKDIEDMVNQWIESISPITWIGGNKRINIEDDS
jgi:hypothetical protein